ncbi:caspase Dronc isoform X2 [Venturia canescens]|uniref:caspase Dronc isoform X2 n=1 Tax=Venturia canescens TaxID=32260 RepID=UPI001C9BF182|nr:caspase Dronc isoform X2 [Venturia canescens]
MKKRLSKLRNRIDKCFQENLSAEETIRDILLKIKTRGPKAFQNLTLCLRETKQHTLADVLQGHRPIETDRSSKDVSEDETSDDSEQDFDIEPDNDDYHKKLRFNRQPLEVKVRKATKFRDGGTTKPIGRYPMRSQPRGYVLLVTVKILNGEVRLAVERDRVCLVKLFEQMGFEVTVTPENMTGQGILDAVESFSKRNFRLVDSCFVIISAHGNGITNEKGVLDTEFKASDDGEHAARRVLASDIIDFFTVKNCPLLKRKPKIFIFQSCRGGKRHEKPRTESDSGPIYPWESDVRNYSDIMVAHATMHGYVAFRDNVSGSWYMQILCEVFMNYAHKLHVQELFQMVDRRLADQRTEFGDTQTSTIKMMGFNRHCYLNPGLFENSNS